jgi:hypothetical protein
MPPAPVAAPAVSLTRSRPASVAVSQAPAGHSAGHSRAASGSIARVPVPSVKGPSKAPTAKASTTAAPSAKAPSAAPKAPTAVPSKAPSKVPSAVPTEKAPTQPAPAPRRRLSTETAGVDFQGWLEKSRDAGAPPAYVPDCASVATAGRLATAREPAALSTLDRAVATRLPSSRAAGSVAGSASVSGSASVVSRPPRAPYPPSFYSARHRPSQIVLPVSIMSP